MSVNAAYVEQTLGKMMAEIAAAAMEQPAGQDAFAYGKAVGVYAGLKMARQKLLDTLKDAEDKTNEL